NTYSSLLTASVIARETPRLIFLIGTAMGKEPVVPLGSVVASDGVIDISVKRLTDDGQGTYVPHAPNKSDELTLDAKDFIGRSFGPEQVERHIKSMARPQRRLVSGGAKRVKEFVDAHHPTALCECIISGNEYRMGSSGQRDDIWRFAPTARAYDMEAAGFALAAAYNGAQWLVVRGVSDYGTPATKSDFNRAVAAGIAARFVREFLREGLVRAESLPLISEPAVTIPRLREEAYRLDGVWDGLMAFLDDSLEPVVFSERAELVQDGANVQ